MEWTAHCDGSAVPNPGRMAYGAVLVSPAGERFTLSCTTHRIGCNNEAELVALLAVLAELQRQGARAAVVFTDNSVLVAQLGDGADAPPAIARLADLFAEARHALACFDRVRLQWVPRHRNQEADALARAAQGLAPKSTALPRSRRAIKARRRSG